MSVIECDIPSASALDRDLIAKSDFRDSYRAPMARPELGIVDIFFAMFGHTPLWMKSLLVVRNAGGAACRPRSSDGHRDHETGPQADMRGWREDRALAGFLHQRK